MYELTNALAGFKGTKPADLWALREGLETLAQLSGPMMPHIAEDLWQSLGHDLPLSITPWPVADQSLTVQNTITMAVQVNGKVRATIDMPRDASKEETRAAAFADAKIQAAVDGKDIRKVIVVPNRIVNIVV